MTDISFCFGVDPFFGWGTIGINMMLHWPGKALCAMPGMRGMLSAGDPRMGLLNERVEQSAKLQRDLAASQSFSVKSDGPVLVAMGNNLQAPLVAAGKRLVGSPTIACPVFEDEDQARENIARLREYDLVFAASTWNRDILRDAGVDAKLALQGVDLAIFNPTVRRKRTDGRFRVFSGGKCEYRKGQDLVLQAFARFAERHEDAVLVAAWGSPWPGLAASFADTPVGAPPGADIGMPNFGAWAQRNGIKRRQIEIVPATPNCNMPAVYGSCDVGLFASRAEGATNLMAMECMACGVPTIVTDVTGHKDLKGTFPCALEVDDIIQDLEMLHANRTLGLGQVDMSEWDWPNRLDEMRELIG